MVDSLRSKIDAKLAAFRQYSTTGIPHPKRAHRGPEILVENGPTLSDLL
jgi:hypothetical protein